MTSQTAGASPASEHVEKDTAGVVPAVVLVARHTNVVEDEQHLSPDHLCFGQTLESNASQK